MNAEQISKQQALQKALQFMPGKNFTVVNDRSLARGEDSQTGGESLYIMNADGGGFVIVSGDDRTEPILGYSDKGEFRTDNMPDNVRNWIEGYVEQIKALDDGGATPMVRARTRSAQPAIEPLITTTWNQFEPYNLRCPNGYPTGCVATALAQVMNYYKWPITSTAIPKYTTGSGILMPELPATSFRWDLMKDDYFGNETDESAEAVAELMLYAGQANVMNYNAGGSGAFIHEQNMIDYFGYSKNMQVLSASVYTTAEWDEIIYHELECKRPVLYSGQSSGGGHQFICDGFDGNGLFHINWGWGGSSDGFFILSVANPKSKGAGGGSGSDGYSNGQNAVIGFQPGNEAEQEFPMLTLKIGDFTEQNYERASISTDFENIGISSVNLNAYYRNTPTATLTLETAWMLYKDDAPVKVLVSKQVVIEKYKSRYYDVSAVSSFGSGLTDGRYHIKLVYRQNENEEWKPCLNDGTEYLVAEISNNKLKLRRNIKTISYTIDKVEYSGEMAKGYPVGVTVSLTNNGDTRQQYVYMWIKQDNQWKKVDAGACSASPGTSGTADLAFTPSVAGTFDVKFTSDSGGNNETGTSTITIHAVEETTIDNITYACIIGAKKAKVTKNTFSKDEMVEEVVIPATFEYKSEQYTVNEICASAFSSCRMEKLTIPNTVTAIGNYAFYSCYNLKEVWIPEGVVSIGKYAFSNCFGLRRIDLPSTLKRIDSEAFSRNSLVCAINCVMTEPIEIGKDVFLIYDYEDGERIESFSPATLYVPVGSKGKYAAAPVWKEFATIYGGELKDVVKDGITYYCAMGDGIATVVEGDDEILDDQDVIIPSKIKADGKECAVKAIATQAFLNISGINSVTIQEGIEKIGRQAFMYCYYLEKVDLPSTLTSIGDQAFAYISSLKTIVARMEEPCSVGEKAFVISKWVDGASTEFFSSATLYVPVNSKTAYTNAETWKLFSPIYRGEPKELTQDGITYQYITGEGYATVTKGDKEELKDKDVTIPSKITADGKDFSVKYIADNAFYNVQMKSLTIEPGVEEIGIGAFRYSSMGGIIVIPEGVNTIGEEAFRSCGLNRIDLPSTLTAIVDKAFAYNTYLETVVTRKETPCTVGENAFIFTKRVDGVSTESFTAATLYVPVGTKKAYAQAEVWKNFSPIYAGEPGELTKDGITYQYITGEGFATVTKGDREVLKDQDVTIPSEIKVDKNSYTVKYISDYAFNSIRMKSLTIEPGMEEIGMGAFRYSSMGGIVVIPEGVKAIGEGAFLSCGLNRIDLPSTLTTIGDQAFASNSYLETVVNRKEAPCTVGENAFTFTKWVDGVSTESFTAATLYVPVGTKKAYAQAEVWKNFSPIYAGEPKELTQDGITYQYITGEGFATVTKGDKEELKDKDVVILSKISAEGKDYSVKYIADNAFNNVQMKSLSIEPGVEEIGMRAFRSSSMGRVLVIPEGVKTIGESAFQSCGLKRIDLPSTLTAIGDQAFASNSYLETVVTRKEAPCTVGEKAFNFTKWVDGVSTESFTAATLYVPVKSKKAYAQAEVWKNFSPIYAGEPGELTKDGITYQYITGEGFATVTKGDREVLKDQDVTIPSEIKVDKNSYTVKYISDYAFNSISMKSLTIEPGVEEIGMGAFWYSSMGGIAVIPEGVKTIGEGAFLSCGLNRIDLPSTLTTIGDKAFAYNYLETVVTRKEAPCTVGEEAFTVWNWVDGVSTESFTAATLYVPVNSKKAYAQAEVWKNFSPIYAGEPGELVQDGITYHYITGEGYATVLKGDAEALKDKDVIIPSKIVADGVTYPVKEIKDNAFCYVYMNSLTIKSGIEKIGDGAFSNSYYLKKIVIPEGVKTIGDEAFRYCGFNWIELPSTLTTIGDKAFAYNNYLKTVVTRMEAPCIVGENAFTISQWVDGASTETFTYATLFVPSGKKKTYKNALVWQKFIAIATLGDADGNGYVQQKDVDTVADHLLGNTPDGFDEKGADANLDSKIDAADIVTIVDMLK